MPIRDASKPDVFGSLFLDFVDEGHLTDLTSLWSKYGWAQRMPQSLMDRSRGRDGNFYFVPFNMDGFGLYYLQPALASTGLSHPPETWQQLEAFCAAWKMATSNPCLTLANIITIEPFIWFDYINWRMHGHEFHRAWLNGDVAFTDPRINATTASLYHFLSSGYIKVDGSLADFYTGTSPLSVFTEAVHKFSPVLTNSTAFLSLIKHTTFPSMNAAVPRTETEGIISLRYCIPTNAGNAAGARDFLEWLMLPSTQSVYFALAPITTPVLNTTTPGDPILKAVADTMFSAANLLHLSWEGLDSAIVRTEWSEDFDAWFRNSSRPSPESMLAKMEAKRIEAYFSVAVTPTASPEPGTFTSALEITLGTLTDGADVYYTLDGSIPFDGSLKYSEPIRIDTSTFVIIRAVAIRPGLSKSPFFEGTYRVVLPSPLPAASSPTTLILLATLGAAIVVGCIGIGGFVYYRSRTKSVTFMLKGDDQLLVAYEDLDGLKPIGMGSFGTVYKASYRGTTVAIKEMHTRKLNEELIETFLAEARVMLNLRHTNIVLFMGACLHPLVLVTEYMSRGSLYDVIHNENCEIGLGLKVKLALDMARGLAFLHSHSFLHRDLKSLNILVDENWVAKVADFGMTSFKLPSASAKTKPSRSKVWTSTMGHGETAMASSISVGQQSVVMQPPAHISRSDGVTSSDDDDARIELLGSMYWTAPEVLENAESYTEASDMYSFGITLWELFARADLFVGQHPFAVAIGVLSGDLRPDVYQVPLDCQVVVPLMERAWAKAPLARPAFSTVIEELDAIRDSVPVVLPKTDVEPVGTVVCATVMVGHLVEAMEVIPREFGSVLLVFHKYVEKAAAKSLGYVWRQEVDRAYLTFSKPTHFVRFIDRLLRSMESHRWPRALLRESFGAPVTSPEGEVVLRGPRVTIAATYGSTNSARDPRTYLLQYSGAPITELCELESMILPGQNLVTEPLLRETQTALLEANFQLSSSPMYIASHGQLFQIARKGRALDFNSFYASNQWSSARPRHSAFDRTSLKHSMTLTLPQVLNQSHSGPPEMASSTCPAATSADPAPEVRKPSRRANKVAPQPSSSSSSSSLQVVSAADDDRPPLPSSESESSFSARPKPKLGLSTSIRLHASASFPTSNSAAVLEAGSPWIIALDTMNAALTKATRVGVGSYTESFVSEWANGRIVLIKKLLQQHASIEYRIMFLVDICLLRQLRHQALLPLQENGSVADTLFSHGPPSIFPPSTMSAMFAERKRRKRRDRQPVLSLADKLCIMRAILDGLHYLHQRGHSFSGLKPTNILLTTVENANGSIGFSAVLSDYGLVELKQSLGTMTMSQTAMYESPEVLRGEERTQASDVFSFGTILFELFTEETVFPRTMNAMEVAFAIARGFEVVIPSSVPLEVADIITSCWATNPTLRPTVASLKASIETFEIMEHSSG
ncbi:TKL protein kinase [Thecamonas trahens ATCC 50062]|uniref:TKL protein kinase n=1 Tax=Thecamonas trahens ATCC 50062 TaxID=461836 RepID=A0A0L0D254_THETB|nr:TKL protein kinase [Thecamonas trahens ATCC 50062]KNC46286.1 TKL protein kinase [Thecamonas trahens ATCC 50062]|eukprot:XP_013760580.1 TKL protein kinase [Thecamonas trahens ATCC 50062]